jgi:hypothetical protein
VEEEVKTANLELGTEPPVVIQVEITKIVVE